MEHLRTLRFRIFTWFLGAIVLSIVASAVVVGTTRPEPPSGVETMARTMAARLASAWGDADAEGAYLAEVRDVTGFDVRLWRGADRLPGHVRRAAERGSALVLDGRERFFVPVTRPDGVLGALEIGRLLPRAPALGGGLRFVVILSIVVGVLALLAGGVADQLSRPLERLALAADRLGSGDLAFRAQAGGASRWVAREVRDVAVSFNRMAERVEATVRGQRELLGAISHELRSPLGRARVALEIARDRLAPEAETGARPAARSLDDVEAQLGAIDAILTDLLAVTRAGLSDLNDKRQDLVGWLRARAAEQPVPPSVEVVAPEASIEVSFDAALLGRVVHNLLVNARAHGHPADRPLELRVTREPDAVRVVVRDRGPGFPPGFAERAFDPFVRGDHARARPAEGAGHGLGLAIVRRIVEAHRGRAFARNAEDGQGGAEVGFDLPAPRPPG
jgi:signal transduction histidine kinase